MNYGPGRAEKFRGFNISTTGIWVFTDTDVLIAEYSEFEYCYLFVMYFSINPVKFLFSFLVYLIVYTWETSKLENFGISPI